MFYKIKIRQTFIHNLKLQTKIYLFMTDFNQWVNEECQNMIH